MQETVGCARCGPATEATLCCTLESVVSVDDRGQLVLPKDVRVRAGIRAGDRLALISYRGADGEICCLALVKQGAISGAVQSVIRPILGGATQAEE